MHPRPWSDPRFFCGAPTRDQAKKIFWEDLKALTPLTWLDGRPSETDLSIHTRWGAELCVVGLDIPARIEGVRWDGAKIDEYANCKPGSWDAHIRPALADRQAGAWLFGVPDSLGPAQKEYDGFCLRGIQHSDPEWDHFNWSSEDILPATEIDSLRRTLDPKLYDQEIRGRFVIAGGLCFDTFDPTTHVSAKAEYDPSLPLCWSLDFNWNPEASGIIQHRNGRVHVVDEIIIESASVDVVCTEFLDRCHRNRWDTRNLTVYGDASGTQRNSVSAATDWEIVRGRLKNLTPTYKVPAGNPQVRDTVNAVRGRLKNAMGEVNLYINPRCARLIGDMRYATWPSDLMEHHCLAWLRYFVDREYPIFEGFAGGGVVGVA